jgi:hypothetical protein
MKKFISQFLKFIVLPAIIFTTILCIYIYYDPFKVVRKYKLFYESGKPRYVALNFGYVAIETFLNNYSTYKYNSFIVGNSRSRVYQMDTWKKYINSDKCFHFDASGESLYGLEKTIKFLDDRNVDIKNLILVTDYESLRTVIDYKQYLFIKHPLLSGKNQLFFQNTFFMTFLNYKFSRAYLDFKISGKVKDYMKKGPISRELPVVYNLKYNEMQSIEVENLIKANRFYTERKLNEFSSIKLSPTLTYNEAVLKYKQKELLNNIKHILNKHNTNYKIVINPQYNQIKFNKDDMAILSEIFGAKNIYDLSGINPITSNLYNYYDASSHYRPHIADEIMRIIYEN